MKYLFPTLFIILLIIVLYINKKIKHVFPTGFKYFLAGAMILTLITSMFVIFRNNDPDSNFGWHIKYMDYKKMHEYATGKLQKIALIDSGVSDFQTNSNENNISLTSTKFDTNGHGTMMYSIIKGYKGEIQGIAPDADVISIKVMDSGENIRPELVAIAINKAIALECTVINLSIGSYQFNQAVSDSIDIALEKGITVVSSSGDYGNNDMLFPANKKGVISVGSISANNQISDFTNVPSEVVINAPGDEIKCVTINGSIHFNSGTSEANALVSGYVALLKEYADTEDVDLSNEKITEILSSINSKKINYSKGFLRIE